MPYSRKRRLAPGAQEVVNMVRSHFSFLHADGCICGTCTTLLQRVEAEIARRDAQLRKARKEIASLKTRCGE